MFLEKIRFFIATGKNIVVTPVRGFLQTTDWQRLRDNVTKAPITTCCGVMAGVSTAVTVPGVAGKLAGVSLAIMGALSSEGR